jgi:multidrug efflux pump subunit AcrB
MRQLQVQIDPERLLTMGVRLDQVIKTAGNAMWVSPLSYLEASAPGSGGWIDTPTQRLAILHTQPISTPADLAQVAVAGTSLKLGDVAKVVEGHPPLIGDAIINGEPLGQKQTSRHVNVMSAIPLKAGIHLRGLHVR